MKLMKRTGIVGILTEQIDILYPTKALSMTVLSARCMDVADSHTKTSTEVPNHFQKVLGLV